MRSQSLMALPFLMSMAGGAFGAAAALAAEPARLARDGSVTIGGREARCSSVRTRLDQRLPNLGAAVPDSGLLILNPTLMGRFSPTVQLFVFHHECGHHRVGASELGADCWAVGQGVRDGWLNARGIAQVCSSFGNAPETTTHPSGKRRCLSLERCFAIATAESERERGARIAASTRQPTLVAGPRLLWTGTGAATQSAHR